MAAHVSGAAHGRATRRLDDPCLTRLVIADEVDAAVLPVLGRAPAGDAELVARLVAAGHLARRARLELRDDVVERHVVKGAGDTHDLTKLKAKVDVPALDRA